MLEDAQLHIQQAGLDLLLIRLVRTGYPAFQPRELQQTGTASADDLRSLGGVVLLMRHHKYVVKDYLGRVLLYLHFQLVVFDREGSILLFQIGS